MFGTRTYSYYSYESNTFVLWLALTPVSFIYNTNTYLTCVNTDVIQIMLLHVRKIRIHKPDTISIRVDIVL